MPGWGGYTWQEYEKCKVALRVGKGKTCFRNCHTA